MGGYPVVVWRVACPRSMSLCRYGERWPNHSDVYTRFGEQWTTTDNQRSERAFTPARIVALVVIGVLALGLGYLRFAPDPSVSVPEGAGAGDLILEPCTYATEDGSYDADCGTLVVPENRADSGSRRWVPRCRGVISAQLSRSGVSPQGVRRPGR